MEEVHIGKYRIIEELGRGGFGTVYKAHDTVLDVDRALKVLHPAMVSDKNFLERFRQEAQLAARLDHPHIVPVYDFGEFDGRFFLAMKYMPGGSLKTIIEKQGPLGEKQAIEMLEQIAGGLDFAHSKGIIHRDLKPSNFLLDQDGKLQISDFGFAKLLSARTGSGLSFSGGMLGTPEYIAPEIWRGNPATRASDIYSIGCVFYEMLTGEVLFKGDNAADIMTKHVLDGPKFKNGLSENILVVLKKALAKDPSDRFATINEFIQALDKEPPHYPPAPPPHRWRFTKKQLLISGGIALFLIAASLFVTKCFFSGTCFSPTFNPVPTEQESTLDVNAYWASLKEPTSTVKPPIPEAGNQNKLIGLLFSDFTNERLSSESEMLSSVLEERGYQVITQEANYDVATQKIQIEDMLNRGVDGLIIVAVDGDGIASAVDRAVQAGVKVIAYDRMINTQNISAYLSFDNVEVGRQQALGVVTALGLPGSTIWTADNPAKVVLSGGSPTDNNAILLRQGQMEVLQPYIDVGIIEIVADFWVDNWDPANALKAMENVLTAQQNDIDAVVASNDGTALGELNALKAQGLAGVVPISGQDATADGCNSIVKGEQTMTVLKDFRFLVPEAVDIMDDLLQGKALTGVEKVPFQELTGRNITGTVNCVFLPVLQITKDNVFSGIVESGFLTYDDVYFDIPLDQLPPR